MNNPVTRKQFILGALVLVFLLGFVTAFAFSKETQAPPTSLSATLATNAYAGQDARMMLEELERERFDQLNSTWSSPLRNVPVTDESALACSDSHTSCDR